MESFDVVVLGGGIAGLSVAWGLVRAGVPGARVVLLEREAALAWHASGRNAAIFRVVDGDPVAVALAVRSRALFAALGVPEVLTRTGGIYLGTPEELARMAAWAVGAGVEVAHLDRAGLVARVPALAAGDAGRGLFVADDGVLDIAALADALARAARAAGVTIETQVTVERIDRDGDRVVGVTCAGGRRIRGGAVVVATGAWAAAIGATCGAPLPIAPVRRHLALLAAPEGVPKGGPIVWRLGEEVYFRPFGADVLASPCDEEPWPPGDPPASPAARERLAERLAPVAPSLLSSKVVRAWACLRTFASDRAFVAGPDPRVLGLFWSAGLGGHGMTGGLALGELVAAAIAGRPSPLAPDLVSRIAPGRLLARALVLDLDGTLADTLDDLAAAVNHVLGALGLPARSRDEIRSFIGEGAANLVRRALPASRADLAGEALAAFRARYAEHLLDATRPYPGVAEALAALEARGVALAVLSNKPQAMTDALVRGLFPGVRFVRVAGERPGVPRKPDPTSALLVAEALGLPPSEIALVGDGGTDVQAARAAGMHAIGVTWGFRAREELVAAGAELLLESPAELLALVPAPGAGSPRKLR